MLNKIDLFGSQIRLRFKGEDTYNTKFGSLFTVLIIGFIGFRLFFIIKDVFQRTSPQVIFNERQVDNPKLFIANKETFPIAFGMQHPISYDPYIDEGIYTIKAIQQIKRLVFNQTTQVYDSVWERNPIKLQPCTAENFGNLENEHYFLKLKYSQMYCFPPQIQLEMQGDFNSEVYSAIRLQVLKCSVNCKPEETMKFYLEKGSFAIQLSDTYIDPTIKSQPFKSYSRDQFFPTSTKMPKDVNIYLRNNYVYSDFGWIMEDIREQIFPSFSFYEASVYPESFQTYFLQVVIRFEKQKENVYQRKYKNLNNIISEIGGFTQSLLAIGLLICTRVSQLHLNQEIINQAFNYEDSENEKNENENIDNDQRQILSKSHLQPMSNSPYIVDNMGNQKMLMLQSNNMLSASNLKQGQFNDNLLSNNNMKKQLELINLSINQEVRQNVSQQKVSSFNKVEDNQNRNNRYSIKNFQPNKHVNPEQMKDSKQILNYLINDLRYGSQEEVIPELVEGLSAEEERIQRQKIKIFQQEQRMKENRFKLLMEKQTNSMKMSVWEYLKSLICPFGELKRKQQTINYSIEKLYQNLDIFNIMTKLIEIEKLKRLLLDQDQIKLFDYIPKPTIKQNMVNNQIISSELRKNEIDVLYQDNRTEMQKARDALAAYQKIVNKSQGSYLDQKLIDLLDPNLVAVFAQQTRASNELQILKQQQQQQLQHLYVKQDSPEHSTYRQHYQEAQQEYVKNLDDGLTKNEEKLLNKEVLSPRINIQSQPILQVSSSNIDKNIIEPKTQREEEQIDKKKNQIIKKEKTQDQDQSNLSEVAFEEPQQLPNELNKNSKPSTSSFGED